MFVVFCVALSVIGAEVFYVYPNYRSWGLPSMFDLLAQIPVLGFAILGFAISLLLLLIWRRVNQ